MRFLDLLTMSINNLRRRKVRTALTVLGVVIGTASVVVMVSLGIGLNALMMEMYSSYGSMTAIEIYNYGNNGNNGTSDNPLYLTDDTVKEFLRIPHVTSASPVLETNVILKQGVYETNTSINGVTREFMEQIPLGQGKLPDPKSTEMEFIYGNAVVQWFQNSKTGKGYWDTQELPDIDYMNKPMFVIFDTDAYYQSRSGGSGDGTPVKAPKKYLIRTAGVVEGGIDDYNSYAYGVYTDIDQLKTQLKKIYKKNPIPGQPTNKKGKPYSYFIYNQAYVYVDDMENVTAVQKAITDMGFQANSQMEWIEHSQRPYNMIQLVLGGIGAISLFVAAIGIANTMMMSIYERTKEIGVIKVLGCDLRTIRNMFLLESGFIGFIGGAIGVAISYGIGFIMNHFLGIGQIMTGQAGDISRIPLWLAAAAVVFAIFVGMAAGFFPSLRAMHLSPLAAIRNE